MSFNQRNSNHSKGLEIIDNCFKSFGFSGYTIGHELDSDEAKQIIQQQNDSTSIMLRYRPDRIYIKPGLRSVLCEIKTATRKHLNFAIEFNSYVATKQWNTTGKHVFYVCFDIDSYRTYCCWSDELPSPCIVKVPKRFENKMVEFSTKYPNVTFQLVENTNGGANTPFFLISKDDKAFINLPDFIRQNLI